MPPVTFSEQQIHDIASALGTVSMALDTLEPYMQAHRGLWEMAKRNTTIALKLIAPPMDGNP